jgi:hypothetical protein
LRESKDSFLEKNHQIKRIKSYIPARHISLYLLILLLLFIRHPSAGQGNQPVNDQFWMDAFVSYNFNKKFKQNAYISYRRIAQEDHWDQVFFNPAFVYTLNKNFQVWGSGVFNYVTDHSVRYYEFRPYAGLMVLYPRIGGFYIQNFFRLEERIFFQNDEGYVSNNLRARYSLFAFIPLNHREIVDKTLYLWPGADYFLDLNGPSPTGYINKSRYNIGIGYRVSKIYRFEICFLEQYSRNSPQEHLTNSDRIFRFVNHFSIN